MISFSGTGGTVHPLVREEGIHIHRNYWRKVIFLHKNVISGPDCECQLVARITLHFDVLIHRRVLLRRIFSHNSLAVFRNITQKLEWHVSKVGLRYFAIFASPNNGFIFLLVCLSAYRLRDLLFKSSPRNGKNSSILLGYYAPRTIQPIPNRLSSILISLFR